MASVLAGALITNGVPTNACMMVSLILIFISERLPEAFPSESLPLGKTSHARFAEYDVSRFVIG
jgi:hypothetical protein